MKLAYFLFVLIILKNSFGLKVLGILNVPALSHFSIGSSILESLHDVGHEITVISPFSKQETGKSFYREILFENLVKKIKAGKLIKYELNE